MLTLSSAQQTSVLNGPPAQLMPLTKRLPHESVAVNTMNSRLDWPIPHDNVGHVI